MKKIKRPRPITVDFETFGIDGRPDYPPKPVGVSIKHPGKKAHYYAWGHVNGGNNCTEEEARAALAAVWDNEEGLLFQNGKFDVDVAETHLGLPIPHWSKIHDTVYLLFLDDPNQKNLSLKPSAERLLGMPPEEQDAVGAWLVENQPVPGVKISTSKKSDHYFGRYIAYAPGDLVGKYADGDVIRTEKLFNLLWDRIRDNGMLEAYDRERRLMPILLENERQGMRVDIDRLREDVKTYNKWYDKCTEYVRRRCKSKDLNVDSGEQLMAALIENGFVDESDVPLTVTGKLQSNKTALEHSLKDKTMSAVINYRSQLGTCLRTFMEPWLATAEKSGGRIFTNWNQTKGVGSDGDSKGARTGRLSSTPNFQNIPKEFIPLFKEPGDRKSPLPACPIKGLPELPKVRGYVIPEDGHVFLDRDYSQQEPRILAHFDGGDLMDTYVENPWTDFHDYAKAELENVGLHYARKKVKTFNLGIIYGMGIGTLAERSEMQVPEATKLKKAILQLYPGIDEMYKEVKQRAKNNEPIRTWGGRLYYCEPPAIVNGKRREYDYKMVNTLIQGSAADCTKEAIIRYDEARRKEPGGENWKLVVNVHDEIIISAPKADAQRAMEVLRQAMESIEFEVPMLSEGKISDVSWKHLVDYDKKGELVYGK